MKAEGMRKQFPALSSRHLLLLDSVGGRVGKSGEKEESPKAVSILLCWVVELVLLSELSSLVLPFDPCHCGQWECGHRNIINLDFFFP